MPTLSPDQVGRMRLCAQRLYPPLEAVAGPAQVVRELCGLQAQELAAATLAVRPRSRGLLAADVERARLQERSVIRTWGPRGTLHLLATEDVGWLLPLVGPVFVAGGRRRRMELGLDEDTCARGLRLIGHILADQGPLTRAEIVEQLATEGLRLEGQARPYLLGRAALEGLICLGPDREAEPTYVLLRDWIEKEDMGQPLPEDAAYTELSRRYLKAYGPATPEDQATWSGLPLSQIRAAWQRISSELLEVEIAHAPAWLLKANAGRLDERPATAAIVRLLPRFDVYLLGYRKRDLIVPPQFAKRINAGGGIVQPTVVVDGRAVGTWQSQIKKNHPAVVVEPFEPLAAEVEVGLAAEVADLSRFLGRPVVWKLPTQDSPALEETAYLLRSPRNVQRLLESIAELETGGDVEQKLTE
ncbi:MAG: crosslink repair DNA glycosylase YcaQ family protein [Chloroflexota bacterium]